MLNPVISCVGDTLWSSGTKFIPPQEPDLSLQVNLDEIEQPEEIENQEESDETKTEETDQPVETEPEPEIEPVDIKKEQDDLLEYCFKAAIKLHLQPKKEQLPILCSTFYSQMMLPSVPTGKTLEIKKSSAKKLSTYFTGLPEGLLKLETVSKGTRVFLLRLKF